MKPGYQSFAGIWPRLMTGAILVGGTAFAAAESSASHEAAVAKVFVNGELVWSEGEATGARPGRVLTR